MTKNKWELKQHTMKVVRPPRDVEDFSYGADTIRNLAGKIRSQWNALFS